MTTLNVREVARIVREAVEEICIMTQQVRTHGATSSVSKYATVRDGGEIGYRLLAGTGAARFALIHSLAVDRHFWEWTAEQLLAAGDVLAFDCRGHAASSGINPPFTAEQFAGDLADLFDAVGWDDVIVAGASMGGCVAPTRIMVSSEDYATPLAVAKAMRDAIPGATLKVLDGAAHLTPLERPEDVARGLLELAGAAR
jgi:pimeloyl-ACP methyl ester carboxylesterase